MIFITVGSQKFQFDRLLRCVDQLVEKKVIQESVFAQTGYCTYVPQNYASTQFLNRDEFNSKVAEADIIITHGGTGAIIGAVKQRKKVIAVPRLAKYGEHVDDHQLQLVSQFKDLNLICSCNDCNNLAEAIIEVRKTHYNKYESKTKLILVDLYDYIDQL